MQQEKQCHQSNYERFFDQLFTQVVYGPFDKGCSVIDTDYLYSLRQPLFEYFKFLFDTRNDIEGVFS